MFVTRRGKLVYEASYAHDYAKVMPCSSSNGSNSQLKPTESMA